MKDGTVPGESSAPGDEAPPGTPGTGEVICPTCHGSGRTGEQNCETCGGTGTVIKAVGDA